MLRVLRMFPFSQAAIKVNYGSGDPKVSKGRSQTSSVLTALWSPPQRRNPCLRERPAMVGSHAVRSRPAGATMCKWWKEQLGGASEDAQSYWQGRFAACTFVERVWHTGRPRNSWGVGPNPSRGAAPAPCKGHCPLTHFLRPAWLRSPYSINLLPLSKIRITHDALSGASSCAAVSE